MLLIQLTTVLVYISTCGRLVQTSPYTKFELQNSTEEKVLSSPAAAIENVPSPVSIEKVPGPLTIEKIPSPFANVLQYYRANGDNSNFPKDSFEPEESEEIDIQKKPTYRLEYSEDDEIIPDEIIPPYASYKYDEKIPLNEPVYPEVEIEMTTYLYPAENLTTTKSVKLEILDDQGDNESSGEDDCIEGELKKIDCNTCLCSEGSFFCSKKKCTMSSKVNGTTQDSLMSQGDLVEKKEQMLTSMSNMMNKKSWKKKMKSTTPLPDCSSGMTKSIDCNQCICAQEKWACTKRSCIALTFREKASYTDGSIMKQVDTLKENHNIDEDCLEDETQQIDCNHCVCHWNTWSCTNVTCSITPAPPLVVAEEIEEACQREGDVKSKECNLCKCRRGVWVCTLNDCQKLGDKAEEEPPSFRSSSKITKEKDI